MPRSLSSADDIRRALSLRDLTDPSAGAHAMQRLQGDVLGALTARWGCATSIHRASPVVDIADNYDRLHYPPGGAARDARYTRYITERVLLRTQTSAMIPPLLRLLAATPPRDLLVACPGLVYRRDTIDRLHTGEPHQIDLWRIRSGTELGTADLEEMIGAIVATALPGATHRTLAAEHPYTTRGLQIDVLQAGEWIEIGECGLASASLLREAGLDTSRVSGLAMGLGLDRLLMLRKGINDIRLLRAHDPRIARQMLDLEPYRAVSMLPPVRRDLSIAVGEDVGPEEAGDRVRSALGDRAASVEEVAVIAETRGEALPAIAIARLGLAPGQKNVLLRVALRDPDRTLTHPEANELRDRIYAALHEGSVHTWAAPQP